MKDTHPSNIRIRSNIQIVATERPFDDHEYLSKIFEKQALEKFPKNVELTPLQAEMKLLATPCPFSEGKIVTPGVIQKNGKYYTVIRCPKLSTCSWAESKGKCNKPREISHFN